MLRRLVGLTVFVSLAVAGRVHPQPAQRSTLDASLLAGMKAREIGPATMSGRVSAIAVVESNPRILYVGAAAGGVWKSTDGGLRFTPIFDDQPVSSIGDIAVNQSSPDIIWVGTGEGNPRNSVSVGNGVYKSVDGGQSWQHAGLEKTERIHRVVLHPTNPNVAWVAALGQLWGQNSDRGVFKTEDGGRTWRKVLYINERTGASDLIIDPSNPNKLFAATWEHRRWPWIFNSGGPGSGLHVTYDGGSTWTRLTEEDGMPKGELGRIGLAVSRSHPNIVYALVEAEKSALLRSDDGGKKWRSVNSESDIAPRPFYYADIRVDPVDPNRLYNVYTLLGVSEDGGKNFRVLVPFARIHPDYHALWINPHDPSHLFAGNDGGVAESRDRGLSWRYITTLPLGQYYHIAVDNDQPYNIYGGMQDNGSWKGPNTTWETAGIRNWDWQEVGFGDGFATHPMPDDPMMGYAMSQGGYLVRWNLRTGERKDLRPSGPKETPLRFNWNAGIAIDPFDPKGLYYGSQFVHRSADRGESWRIISPDLTTNRREWQQQERSGGLTIDNSTAENHTTIIAIAPSPRDRNVIWAGTDDGRVHVTRDGGGTWLSVETNIKGVPANTWVAEIKASPHDAATAFVVFDDHRRSNWTPYLFRTRDYGRTWTSLATKDVSGYAHAVEQDPVNPDVLFLGTEFGLFFTVDGGTAWNKWTHGVPTTPVSGLVAHPRDHDLVIGTHGRSAYVIDDIRPLRTVTSTMSAPLHLYEVPEAQQFRRRQKEGSRFVGEGEYRGQNEEYGALLTYSLNLPNLPHPADEKERERKAKERETATRPVRFSEAGVPSEMKDVPKEPEAGTARQADPGSAPKSPEEETGPKVDIEIHDAAGKRIRKFKGPAKLGLNRTAWDLRRDAFKEPKRETRPGDDENEPQGPEIVPGQYTATIKFRGKEAKRAFRVVADPRVEVPAEARAAKWAAIERAGKAREALTEAVERIRRVRSDADAAVAMLRKDDSETEPNPLVTSSQRLKSRLDAVEHRLWTPPRSRDLRGNVDAWSRIGYVLNALQSSWDAPTPAQMDHLEAAESIVRAALAEANAVLTGDVGRFREEVVKQQIQLLPEKKPIDF